MTTRLTVSCWPYARNRDRQPYTYALYEEIRRRHTDVEVVEYTFTGILRRPDVLHVHWPDTTLGHPSRFRAWALTLRTLAAILAHRLVGTRIVWTAHNSVPHDARGGLLDGVYFWAMPRLLDAIIYPSDWVREQLPFGDALPSDVIPIGPGETALVADGTITPRAAASEGHTRQEESPATRYGYVGRIAPYKGIESLVRAFSNHASSSDTLTIAGATSTKYAETLRDLSREDARISLNFSSLQPQEYVDTIESFDVAVLPYRNITHSGSALSCLYFGVPVVAPSVGALPELAGTVGEAWLFLFDGDLDSCFASIREWAAKPRSGVPTLAPWNDIADRTVALYRSVTDVSRMRLTQRPSRAGRRSNVTPFSTEGPTSGDETMKQ